MAQQRSKWRNLAVGAAAVALSGAATAITVGVSASNNIAIKPQGTACGQCYAGRCGCVNITLTPYDPFATRAPATAVAVNPYQPTGAASTVTAAPRPATVTPSGVLPTLTPLSFAPTPQNTPGIDTQQTPQAFVTTTPGPTRTPTATPFVIVLPTNTPVPCPNWTVNQTWISSQNGQIRFSSTTGLTNVGITVSPSTPTNPQYQSVSVAAGVFTWTFTWSAPSAAGTYTLTFTQNGLPVSSCTIEVFRSNSTATPIPFPSATPTEAP